MSVCVCYHSVMRVTVLQQTVSHVADPQQVSVVLLLHSGVNGPAHHLHPSLCPVLNVVPDWKEGGESQDETNRGTSFMGSLTGKKLFNFNYLEMKSFCTRMAEIPQSFHSTWWWAQSNKTSRTPVHSWLHVDRERGVPSPKRLSLQGRWVRAVTTWGSVWRICEVKGQHRVELHISLIELINRILTKQKRKINFDVTLT